MSSKIIYKEELTVQEEYYEVRKMIGLLESLLKNKNHCNYRLHLRSYSLFKERYKELKAMVIKIQNETPEYEK
jgi:hypothetical protein